MANSEISQEQCNLVIDYTQQSGDRILPFRFELDLAASNLTPGPGENQRFCYNITAHGLDNSDYADLSHFVLSICDKISAADIVSATVDGEEQELGGDVELRPPNNPDPPTGCPGLKFDFGLDKVDGEMTFCFELARPYPIGPNEVCLFGAGRTASGLRICGPVCGEIVEGCPSEIHQPLSVCVPITITPFVNDFPPTTICCGPPVITPGGTCPNSLLSPITFSVTQQMCVSIPLEFGAIGQVGSPSVQLGTPSTSSCPPECGSTNDIAAASNGKKKKYFQGLLNYLKVF